MIKKQDKLIIRDFIIEDIDAKILIINNFHNNKHLHYDLPLVRDKTVIWFNNIKDNPSRLDLTILYDNMVIGFIGLLNIDNKNKKAEYYICVDYKYSGKGIATISSNMLLSYAFDELALEKIYLYTEVDNLKAQHLFEKLGFLNEGLLRNDIIYNKRTISRYVYGMLKGDFNGKNNYTKNG